MTKKPKIAVLTSGGDSAGMNAVVRAIVKYGIIKYVFRALNLLLMLMVESIGAARHMLSAKATKVLCEVTSTRRNAKSTSTDMIRMAITKSTRTMQSLMTLYLSTTSALAMGICSRRVRAMQPIILMDAASKGVTLFEWAGTTCADGLLRCAYPHLFISLGNND